MDRKYIVTLNYDQFFLLSKLVSKRLDQAQIESLGVQELFELSSALARREEKP